MTEGIATQQLVTAVEHVRKLRAYLAPRTAWSAEYGARDALGQTHLAVTAFAAAIGRLMAANHFTPEAAAIGPTPPPVAGAGQLDAEQLAKVAAFVTRMERWFAARSDARVDPEGRDPLQQLHQLLEEVVHAAEAAMRHNGIGFEAYRAAESAVAQGGDAGDEEALPDHMSRLCPKCGAPRVAGAIDCPECGVIYARAVQQAVADGEAESLIASREELDDDAASDEYDEADRYGEVDEYGEPAPSRSPLPLPRPATRVDRLRAAIDADTWIFVAVALLLYLGVVGFMTGRLIGGSDSVRGAKDLFHEATGRKMRFPLPNAMALNWVDHRFVVFASSDQQLQLVLYTEGALARKTELDVLRSSVDEIIRLMELPIIGTATRRGHIGPSEVDVRELRFGQGEVETGRAYMTVFSNPKGRPVVVFMYGPKLDVKELAREVFAGD